MVDLGEETREDFEDSDVSLPVSSSVGYYHTHHVPRLSSWRQNVQAQEPTSRHSMLESVRQDFVQVKSDPENTSRFCSSVNNMSVLGTGTSSSPSADAAEDIRMRGQLLQEITRVAETFEPYSGSSTSSVTYRSYNLAPDATQTPDAEYIISDTPQWMWSRIPGDERSFAGSIGNGILVGSGQVSEPSIGSLQYPIPSQLMPDAFSVTLPSLTESEAAASIASSSSMMQRPQHPSSALPSSALDLSPASPMQAASLLPQVVHISCVSTPPVVHQILPSQGDADPLDPDMQQQQQQQAPLSYHQNVEGSLEFGDIDEEENPDDVDYQPDLKCNQCGATFMHLQHLKLHIKRDSCASVQTDEEIQNKNKVPSSSVLEKPKRPQRLQTTQQLFSCKHCDETFSRAERLKVHELNHSGERPFHCNECAASFNTKTMLARHKKIHTGEKPYSCGECKTCFTESGSLKVHMRLHTGDRPYKCDWCEEAFSGAGMLASHKRKHTGEKPYICSNCGASFRLLSTLKSHSRRHTGEKPFVCELCGSSFTQKAALRRHKRTHLNIKPYECEHCGFKFREKENLRRHRLLHKMKLPFICDICGAGFNNSKKLENHKMLHNGGEKPYECNKCPSSFASPKYLTQHKRRVHERKGSIRCEECNATFNRRETLRSHMRIHKGAGQYICSECGATFNQRATLTRHLRIHGDKAFVETASSKESFTCRLCNTVFNEKASLESHIMEHRVVEDFAYECPSCYLGFSDQLDLVKHKRIHHPVQRPVASTRVEQDDDNNEPVRDKYVCQDCDQTFFRKRQLKAHKKFCLCKDLDQVEEPEEMKPNVVPQNTNKEVSAMKLVSAVLAAAGNSTSDIDYQLSPSAESLPSAIPFSTVSTPSVAQLSQRYVTQEVSLSHDGMYEHQVDQGHHQQVSCQQPPQQGLLHQSANHEIVQSVQDSLQTSAQDHIEQVEQQSHMQGQTQGTLPQQSLRDDVHHHPFDFDISQHDFYKSLPPQHSSHHHLSHRHDHQDADQESQLLQGSVLQSISQDLEGCDDLHSSMRQWFVPEHREHFREDIRQPREQHRFLPRLDDNMKEPEHNSLPQQHENHYQNPCQSQFHSYDQYRISKLDEKYDDTTQQQHQHYVLQDQSTLKTRNVSPKSVGSYSNVRNKY